MADITRNIFDPVKSISRILFQKRRPALDSEVNVIQDNFNYEIQKLIIQLQAGSGAVQPGAFSNFIGTNEDHVIKNDSGLFLANGTLYFVGGSDNRPFPTYDVLVNRIKLDTPPLTGLRKDFIWLEMWEEEIDQNGVFYKWGNLLTTTVPNDIVDPGVGFPTTLRMIRRYEIRIAKDAETFGSNLVRSKEGRAFIPVNNMPNLYVDRAVTEGGLPHYGVALAVVTRNAGQNKVLNENILNLFENVSLGSGGGGLINHANTHKLGGVDELDIRELKDSEYRLPTTEQTQALVGASGDLYPPSELNPFISKDYADANYGSSALDVTPLHIDEVVGNIDGVLPNRLAKYVTLDEDNTLPNASLLSQAYNLEDYVVSELNESENKITLNRTLPFPDNGKSVKVLLSLVQIPHTKGFTVTSENEITFEEGLILEGDELQISWPNVG